MAVEQPKKKLQPTCRVAQNEKSTAVIVMSTVILLGNATINRLMPNEYPTSLKNSSTASQYNLLTSKMS